MKNINDLSKSERKDFLDSIDSVFTDCDGVLWLGNVPIPGAVNAINRLKEIKKNVFFVTNNSTKTRKDLLEKSANLGFQVTFKEMVTSAWLTAIYLKSINFAKKAYIIGGRSISEELAEVGIKSFGFGPDPYVSSPNDQAPLKLDSEVEAVIVGIDVHFSFPKMMKACNYLRNPKCLFIATNPDPSLPIIGNIIQPGAGSFVKAIETCSSREPLIMGKPSKMGAEEMLAVHGLNHERTLMIGDRCTTDIAFGNDSGMITLLVLSGIDNLDIVEQYEKENKKHLIPAYYAESIADLNNLIETDFKN